MSADRGLRAADGDRQAVAARLLRALEEGRLDLLEYDDRLARAYRAVTYADLDTLVSDLPNPAGPAAAAVPPAVAPHVAHVAGARRVVRLAGLPTPLRVLWTLWAAVVTVNLTVWLLVSLGNGTPDSFWPMWLAVPGAVLLAVTGAVRMFRTGGRP